MRARGTRARANSPRRTPLRTMRALRTRGPAQAELDWAELPRDLLERVGRAVPAGDRLWFRLVCRRWAAAGAGVAQPAGEREFPRGNVTRTRGADAAASVARVEMVFKSLKGYDRKK